MKKKWWRFPAITIPKSVSEECAKNLRMTFQYSDVFLYETFSFIFGLGFDFGSDSSTGRYQNVIIIFFVHFFMLWKAKINLEKFEAIFVKQFYLEIWQLLSPVALKYTANISVVKITLFNCVRVSTVIHCNFHTEKLPTLKKCILNRTQQKTVKMTPE